jgi:hypothetical protein
VSRRAPRSGWPAGTDRRASRPDRRAILATLGCAGLRNSEGAVNICDLDFAPGVIHVRHSKTDAVVRPGEHETRYATSCSRATRPHAQATDPALPT